MLTIPDLNKIDRLVDDTVASIKAAQFGAAFEMYLRTQFAIFMATTVDDYNVFPQGKN